MPTFEFKCETCGTRRDHLLRMSKAPAVGEKLTGELCCGQSLTRILSVPTLAASIAVQVHGYPYVSRRHSGLPGCKETPEGHSIIESPRHEREVMARTGLVRE